MQDKVTPAVLANIANELSTAYIVIFTTPSHLRLRQAPAFDSAHDFLLRFNKWNRNNPNRKDTFKHWAPIGKVSVSNMSL